ARRAPGRIERAALVGKTQRHRRPFAAVPASDRAADHDRAPSAARARRYPLNRATRLLYAMTIAAAPKQPAEANARLNTVIHMSRSSRLQAGARPVSRPPAPELFVCYGR